MYSILYIYDILDRIFLKFYVVFVEYILSCMFLLFFFLVIKDYGKLMIFIMCFYLILSVLIGRNK